MSALHQAELRKSLHCPARYRTHVGYYPHGIHVQLDSHTFTGLLQLRLHCIQNFRMSTISAICDLLKRSFTLTFAQRAIATLLLCDHRIFAHFTRSLDMVPTTEISSAFNAFSRCSPAVIQTLLMCKLYSNSSKCSPSIIRVFAISVILSLKLETSDLNIPIVATSALKWTASAHKSSYFDCNADASCTTFSGVLWIALLRPKHRLKVKSTTAQLEQMRRWRQS